MVHSNYGGETSQQPVSDSHEEAAPTTNEWFTVPVPPGIELHKPQGKVRMDLRNINGVRVQSTGATHIRLWQRYYFWDGISNTHVLQWGAGQTPSPSQLYLCEDGKRRSYDGQQWSYAA